MSDEEKTKMKELEERVAKLEKLIKETVDWIAITEPSKLPPSVASWSY